MPPTGNTNGLYATGIRKFDRCEAMRTYDSLSPEMRKFIYNHPFKLSAESLRFHTVESAVRALKGKLAKSCELTYGPDHPQATED